MSIARCLGVAQRLRTRILESVTFHRLNVLLGASMNYRLIGSAPSRPKNSRWILGLKMCRDSPEDTCLGLDAQIWLVLLQHLPYLLPRLCLYLLELSIVQLR